MPGLLFDLDEEVLVGCLLGLLQRLVGSRQFLVFLPPVGDNSQDFSVLMDGLNQLLFGGSDDCEKILRFRAKELQLFWSFGLQDGLIEVDALFVDDLKSGVVEVELLEQHEVALLPQDHFGFLLGWRNDEESVVVLRLDMDLLWLLDLLRLGLWSYLDLLDLLLWRHHNGLNRLRRDITGSALVIEHNPIRR